jgi:hypothetical protein
MLARALAGTLLAAAIVLTAAAGSGFGATSANSTVQVVTTVNDALSLTDPATLDASPAPSDGATWSAGSPNHIWLGSLQGSQVGSASATWKVSTTGANGYSVEMSSLASNAPMMRSGADSFPDMCAIGSGCPAPLSTGHSHFGVAVGSPTGHNQGAVTAMWGTSGAGGTQGTLYAGVPVGGVAIAQRSHAVTNDPFTIDFAAVSASSDTPPPGSYAGTIRLVVTSL